MKKGLFLLMLFMVSMSAYSAAYANEKGGDSVSVRPDLKSPSKKEGRSTPKTDISSVPYRPLRDNTGPVMEIKGYDKLHTPSRGSPSRTWEEEKDSPDLLGKPKNPNQSAEKE